MIKYLFLICFVLFAAPTFAQNWEKHPEIKRMQQDMDRYYENQFSGGGGSGGPNYLTEREEIQRYVVMFLLVVGFLFGLQFVEEKE